MQNIFWTAYSDQERHAAINQIQALVAQYGDLVDIRLFSDISITMTIEIAECKIDKLHMALANMMSMDAVALLDAYSTKERTIYLNISFLHATGDLKQEVPAVPG